MHSHRVLLAGTALFILGLTILKPVSAQTLPSDNFGFVRFIHTAIDVPPIDIYAGEGSQTPVASGLSYGQATNFMTLPATTQGYVARPAGSGPNGEALFRLNRRVKPNQSEIIAAAGLAGRKAFVLEPLVLVRNNTRGYARVRVFNMVWGGPYLTVKDNKGAVYGQDLQYLSSSGDVDLTPGTYGFEIESSGTGKTVATIGNIDLESDKVYSVMIVGGMDGTPAIRFILLTSDQESTRVRIVNNGSSSADIYIKGQDKPFVAGIAPGAATGFTAIPSGATTFVLRAAGSPTNSSEMAFVAPQLRPGRDITITINGSGVATQMGITDDHLTQPTPTAVTGATATAAAATGPTLTMPATATAAGKMPATLMPTLATSPTRISTMAATATP